MTLFEQFCEVSDEFHRADFNDLSLEERSDLAEEYTHLHAMLYHAGMTQPDRAYYRLKAQRAGRDFYECGGKTYRTDEEF